MHCIARHLNGAAMAIAVSCVLVPATVVISVAPATAQRVEISAEFRSALEPYGQFRRHPRWGEVWSPADVGRDWKPYTVGHWVYSDDYGWYWASDDTEAAWGWVTYHYGRWAWDDDLGWIWVPGRDWGPAWVEWRRGSRHLGWAPLPPDEIVTEIREEPRYWVFVEPRDFVAPDIARVVVRPEPTYLRDTVVVNETVVVRERNFAVNPGIPPAIVAAAVGRALPTYDVRPRVFAGTTRIPGAVEVRADDLRRDEFRRAIRSESTIIRQSSTAVQPERNVPPPRALGANERGRLGDKPPRAVTGTATERERSTSGAAAPERPPGPQQPGLRERAPQGPVGTSPERDRGPQQGQRERERGTSGAAAPERPSGPQQPGLRERGQQGPVGAPPERDRGPQQGQRERERGTSGAAAPERPSGPQQPALRERAPQGPTGSIPERGPQPAQHERERGTSGAAAPEHPSGPQQPALRERAPQGPTGSIPQRGPQPAQRERERGTSGAAPERPSRPEPGLRGPEPGARERGTSGAAPERPAAPPPGLRERGPQGPAAGPQPGARERATSGAAPMHPSGPQPGPGERGPGSRGEQRGQ